MSDKEFDKQFKGKFDDFEIEPSPMVWEGINKSLAATQKRSFPVLEVAAASMAALVAFGLWFAPHKEPMKLYGKSKAEEVPAQTELNYSKPSEQSVTVEPQSETVTLYPPASSRNFYQARQKRVSNLQEQVNVEEETPLIKEPVEIAQTITVAETPNELLPLSTEVLKKQQTQREIFAFNQDNSDTTTDKSRHRIKSLGDLVNFVVARVDKRKNKIIEFSKDDEGEEISGLNFGLLQYKTRTN